MVRKFRDELDCLALMADILPSPSVEVSGVIGGVVRPMSTLSLGLIACGAVPVGGTGAWNWSNGSMVERGLSGGGVGGYTNDLEK